MSTVTLLLAMSLSSCTCHKDLPPRPEPTPTSQPFKEREGGLSTKSPSPRIAGATPTPEVQQAADQPAVALPGDFPREVPIFGDAKVDQVQELPNNAHNVVFRTSGSVTEVTRFYHDQLSGSGWNVTQQFERPNHAFMTYRKGNLIANVTIAEDSRTPGQQVIAIMYEEEKPLPFDEF